MSCRAPQMNLTVLMKNIKKYTQNDYLPKVQKQTSFTV